MGDIHYFAYGSNMNPRRMTARGLSFHSFRPATLPGFELVFNKRAHNKQGIGYANISRSTTGVVAGVLYELDGVQGLRDMDHFEGTPVRYSRDLFHVHCDSELVSAWVSVANPAYIEDSLAVEGNYLRHLLAAESLLPSDYVEWLRRHPSLPATVSDDEHEGLRFNV